MNELIQIKNEQAVTSSLIVAEQFNKRHDQVLRDIDEILSKSPQKCGSLFEESTYIHSQNKQEYRMFYMNRDGFSILAMGFTGTKAMDFKLDFINAFNVMEIELNSPEKIMARALRIANETLDNLKLENKMQEQQIKELKPKADYVDDILKNPGLVTITQIAKDYGMSGQEMNKVLKENGIQYKQSNQWLLYAKYQDQGYTHSDTTEIKHSNCKDERRRI